MKSKVNGEARRQETPRQETGDYFYLFSPHPTPHTPHPTPHFPTSPHPTPYTLFQVRRQGSAWGLGVRE
ncbi:MAG: hypothetical protein EWV40_16460 [Microcystis flos-aquae Mf_WU_F_19750830_S460]|uniref:Uncharacterized protein n=1 Tax=Microcystis flos-aquae Mf_WU_F_19750830_S460 TaxID=2486237 RepID=A0A552LF75_9CHRO|nr:MAG: hypothetical protein EWV40_16460 [Microcystis flos-aquae Mf_WU_F_19750830_S460]